MDFELTTLGNSGLRVSRLGIGSSFGLEARDVCSAVDRGVNFLYWGSIPRPAFGKGIRESIAAHGRDRVVVALQTYTRVASLMSTSVAVSLRRLHLEYADVLILGMWNKAPWDRIYEAAVRLKEKGRIRHIIVSGHDRPKLAEMAGSGRFSAIMCRYNAAHRGAEREIFPHLGEDRVGTIAYTATRWGTLLTPVGGKSEPPLTSTDCYRFCLSHPQVDLTLCGPKNAEELELALDAIRRGPLDESESARVRAYGDLVYEARMRKPPRLPWQRTVR